MAFKGYNPTNCELSSKIQKRKEFTTKASCICDLSVLRIIFKNTKTKGIHNNNGASPNEEELRIIFKNTKTKGIHNRSPSGADSWQLRIIFKNTKTKGIHNKSDFHITKYIIANYLQKYKNERNSQPSFTITN